MNYPVIYCVLYHTRPLLPGAPPSVWRVKMLTSDYQEAHNLLIATSPAHADTAALIMWTFSHGSFTVAVLYAAGGKWVQVTDPDQVPDQSKMGSVAHSALDMAVNAILQERSHQNNLITDKETS